MALRYGFGQPLLAKGHGFCFGTKELRCKLLSVTGFGCEAPYHVGCVSRYSAASFFSCPPAESSWRRTLVERPATHRWYLPHDLDGVPTMALDDLLQYGQEKAKEIYQRRERRKIEIERASADSKLKAMWGPKLWELLREAIIERVKSINAALGEPALICDATRTEWIILRVNQVFANISAAYDAASGKVTLNLDDHSEIYDLEVVKGEVKYKEIGFFSPDQLAKMLVDKASYLVL
jgi:hypothetical protein